MAVQLSVVARELMRLTTATPPVTGRAQSAHWIAYRTGKPAQHRLGPSCLPLSVVVLRLVLFLG